jgi:hypothetical protein
MLHGLLPDLRREASLDPYLLDLLRHMLGAWPDDPGRARWGRRNYFMTGAGPVDDALRRLVAGGMARVGSCAADDIRIYHATEKGCLAVGMNASQTRRALAAAMESGSRTMPAIT